MLVMSVQKMLIPHVLDIIGDFAGSNYTGDFLGSTTQYVLRFPIKRDGHFFKRSPYIYTKQGNNLTKICSLQCEHWKVHRIDACGHFWQLEEMGRKIKVLYAKNNMCSPKNDAFFGMEMNFNGIISEIDKLRTFYYRESIQNITLRNVLAY